MQYPKKIKWIVFVLIAVFIKIFSSFPYAVEKYYSTGLYPYISLTQRVLFGWIPFSIGDIFYLFCFFYLLGKCILFIRAGYLRKLSKQSLLASLKRVVFVCLVIYVLFNSLWGLNYNRLPMTRQMNLPLEPYSSEVLENILVKLVHQVNETDSVARINRRALLTKRILFLKAIQSYATVKKEMSFFRYGMPSVKPSLYSYAGNYLGFTGYYNPFSGEAQSNTTVPVFMQPFTTCHEIGHQLGYAKENEANFAGFLAARSSVDPAFRYSVYFDMYSYAIRELYARDSVAAKGFQASLHPDVREDFTTIREFYKKYETPIEPIISKLYGDYLKANEQPEGLHSYNEVVAMLVAYYKKYGYI